MVKKIQNSQLKLQFINEKYFLKSFLRIVASRKMSVMIDRLIAFSNSLDSLLFTVYWQQGKERIHCDKKNTLCNDYKWISGVVPPFIETFLQKKSCNLLVRSISPEIEQLEKQIKKKFDQKLKIESILTFKAKNKKHYIVVFDSEKGDDSLEYYQEIFQIYSSSLELIRLKTEDFKQHRKDYCKKITQMMPPQSPKKILNEILEISQSFNQSVDLNMMKTLFDDIRLLYLGKTEKYRSATAPYHDYQHTCEVTIASIRLLYGYYLAGYPVTETMIYHCFLTSLFHDTGYIQEKGDQTGTGAKYTIGHEDRSIRILKEYLAQFEDHQYSIESCSKIIESTKLSQPFDKIKFDSEESFILAKILASTDLLAQMADHEYLEKCLSLNQEFNEAKTPNAGTDVQLLVNTENFYNLFAKKRLESTLGEMQNYFSDFFENKLGIRKNLYIESVEQNIRFLNFLNNQFKKFYIQ